MPSKALVSVSDKKGIIPFAAQLSDAGIEIVSTGGTGKVLEEAGITVTKVSEITGFSEILNGRVKTLHPAIHGGLLADTTRREHIKQITNLGIAPIDIVVVNLYPFAKTIVKPGANDRDAIENIDIGGPSMLRSAAKNYKRVTVVVDPDDYESVIASLSPEADANKKLLLRQRLAAKAFRHSAAYDAVIARYLTECTGEAEPEILTLSYTRKQNLRYGENPHQKATFYRINGAPAAATVAAATQLHGKELSYNNINDANASLEIVKEFSEPAAVAVKHMNPCGVGIGKTIEQAYDRAYAADPTSIFGGIIAVNREVDAATAAKMATLFIEMIIAPAFSETAQKILMAKKPLRLLEVPPEKTLPSDEAAALRKTRKKVVSVQGGLLVQDEDTYTLEDADPIVPTQRRPSGEEWEALRLGWKVVKHVKSNAIVLSDGTMTVGIGAGQMNRVGSATIAIEHAGARARGAVLASDAFFPYPDTVEEAAAAGITAIIQPGGSIRDAESIAVADEHDIAMVFTNIRHFKH